MDKSGKLKPISGKEASKLIHRIMQLEEECEEQLKLIKAMNDKINKAQEALR